jgi:hypothetical protein
VTPTHVPIVAVDASVAAWCLVWLIAAVAVVGAVRQLEDGGEAVVTASVGLRETSTALRRAAGGLHETGDALRSLGRLPFVRGNPGAGIERTAVDVDRIAGRVATTAADARRTGIGAQESARTLALVLGFAIALGPTVPLAVMYLLLRPLVAERLRSA